MFNGNMANPFMSNSSFDASIYGAEVVDKFWQVTNTGDTSSSYTLKTIAGDGELPPGYYCQLLVYKVHRYPAIDPLPDEACVLLFDDSHELLLNIDNANLTPDITNYSKIVDPELANADFRNATFSLAPGEEAVVILRVVDTNGLFPAPSAGGFGGFIGLGGFGGLVSSFGAQNDNSETDPEDYADNVGAVVISHSSTEGDLTAITLMILPASLASGQVGVWYTSDPLRAIGGTGIGTYTWSLYEGLMPLGVDIQENGTISGCPEQAGEFNFTIQVKDSNQETDTQKFTLTIVGTPPITIGMDQSVVPFGMKDEDYSGNLSFEADGGIRPYTEWELSAVKKGTIDSVNLGLSLISSGIDKQYAVIDGTPSLAGEFTVTVKVFDSSCQEPKWGTLSFDLCVSPVPLTIAIAPPLKTTDPPALVDGTLGTEYNVEFLVSNWESTLVWGEDIADQLPPGLEPVISGEMNEKMSITGVPVYDETKSYPASYTITVSVTDNFPNCDPGVPRDITRNFAITINPKRPVWAAEGTQDGEAIAVTSDEDDNVYVTGYIIGEGKDFYTVKYDVDGNFVWDRSYNGPGNGDDMPSAIAVDDSGVYVTGTILGEPTGEGQDIYTVKYDITDGHILWESRYDGPSHMGDGGNALTLDKSGNPHVAGYVHRGNVKKHADYSAIKYSRLSGEIIWDEGYDSTRNGNDVATAIAVDSSGNVYVTGKSQESSPKDTTTQDYLTIKYNSSGEFQWDARDDGLGFGEDEPTAIVIHEVSANEVYIYVTGCATGQNAVEKDYYTVAYDANGNDLWQGGRTYNGPGNGDDIASSIDVDSNGNVYVTGKSLGSNGYDFATIKYDSNGNQLWDRRYDCLTGDDEAVSLAVDGSDVYVAGFITTEENGIAADKDFLLIKYDTSGDIIWIAQYDGPSGLDDVATAMAVNSGIHLVGHSWKDAATRVYAVVKFEK
jgi:hypothetical protein